MEVQNAEVFEGLPESEAAIRLKKFGFNELPIEESKNWIRLLLSVVREPMVLFLVACGTLYLLLGAVQEAIPLLLSIAFVITLSVFQQRKTEKALSALKKMSSPRALVLREGMQKRIPGREVVPGDIVYLKEGDRVPADGVLLSQTNLLFDESILTGESFPVEKVIAAKSKEHSRLYSSSLVVRGSGIMQTTSTGRSTEVGKIGKSLQDIQSGATALQREISKLTKFLGFSAVILCLIIFLAQVRSNGGWIEGLLTGLTAAMALIPEEFSVILSIFFALGAWRMSKSQALVRYIPAIEALGSISVLCVDKTGTITMNQMSVSQLTSPSGNKYLRNNERPLPDNFHSLAEYAALASHKDPFDPMEKAIMDFYHSSLSGTDHIHPDWELVREYPLTPELLAMSCVWKSKTDLDYLIASKGAPEAIFDLCHLPKQEVEKQKEAVRLMAQNGLRIIGVAQARFSLSQLPEKQHDFIFEYLGLVGLEDPVRPGVTGAIQECQSAGIKIVMITGDYPETAQNIAKQIGIPFEKVMSGADLESADDQSILDTTLFARISPNQKLKIVETLKRNQGVVAMTGDGVNDGPSLKAADVGISMGKRGTDVAREASDIVLLDDNFTTIVSAVKQGRRIFDNLRKAVSYVLAIHVPIAGMSLLPAILNLPLALLPIHIVFLELVIDPGCSLAFEGEPAVGNLMSRKPRKYNERVFDRRLIASSLLKGLVVFIFVASIYFAALNLGRSGEEARTYSFIVLLASNFGLILVDRTKSAFTAVRESTVLLTIILGGSLFVLASLSVPGLRELFMFSQISVIEVSVCIAFSIVGILMTRRLGFTRSHL